MTSTPNDPRPLLTAAARWTGSRVAGVSPEQLDRPTPCTDFDVGRLVSHLHGVLIRLDGVGAGQRADDLPRFADVDPDRLGPAYDERLTAALAQWEDDATLTRIASAPFGEVPGAAFLAFYTMELLTHGWDLAVATGQDPEADPELAGAALAIAQRGVPVGDREGFPFAAAVEPRPDAGPTERLANHLGRVTPMD